MENKFRNTDLVGRRYWKHKEIRAEDGTDGFDFQGLASSTGVEYIMYEDEYEIWTEEVAPTAFDEVLSQDIRVLVDHISHKILGRTTAGTAKVWVDSDGFRYAWKNPDTTAGRDIAVSIERKDVTQSSFGFRTNYKNNKWEEIPLEDGRRKYKRTIMKFDEVYDVSPVSFPANPDTEAGKRDYHAAIEEYRKQKQQSTTETTAERAAEERSLEQDYEYLEIEMALKLR